MVHHKKVEPVIMPCYPNLPREEHSDLTVLGDWSGLTWCTLDTDVYGYLVFAPFKLGGFVECSNVTLRVRNYNKKELGDIFMVKVPGFLIKEYENTVKGANGTGGYQMILEDAEGNVLVKKYTAKKYALDTIKSIKGYCPE